VRPIAPDAERQVLAAFLGTLDQPGRESLLAEPEPPSAPTDDLTTLARDEVRYYLRGIVESAALLHRALMAMEKQRLPRVSVRDSEAALTVELLHDFALTLRDAVNTAIRQRHEARSWRTVGKYRVAKVSAMSDEQYADAMRFSSKRSVDLIDGESFAWQLNAGIPADVLDLIATELDMDDQPDDGRRDQSATGDVETREDDLLPVVDDDDPDVLRPGETLPTPDEIRRRALAIRGLSGKGVRQ
jgi:hypothetical protein